MSGAWKGTLRRKVFGWYREAQRSVPWRKTHDPYRILVSEIMLQQTQVNHVVEKYREFLRRFPTIRSLARARVGDVIRAWSGLGYNGRALRLHKAAQEIVEKWGGRIPSAPGLLLQLPGIGKYTANAIACFAYRCDVPVVDTNIRRVISRLFFRTHLIDERTSERLVWEIAGKLLPKQRSRDWTLALMDLGSTVCTAQNPSCSACPLKAICRSAFALNKRRVNVRKVKKEPSHEGIPNRIYRGRIVEILRRIDGERSLSLRDLGRRMKAPFRKSEEIWMLDLLEGLQRDGLIRLITRASRVRVSLP